MVIAAETDLGIGIYSPAEVALYARVRTQTINRWFYGHQSTGAVVMPQRGADSKDISFLDFVQALAIRAIRRVHGVPLQKIRGTVEFDKVHYGVSHPLAMQHTTYLYDRQGSAPAEADADARYDLVIKLPLYDDSDKLIAITGKTAGNQMIKEVVELFLKDVSFGESGLAEAYSAWQRDGLEITMNPKRHFGEPLLPSGYTAPAIWEAVKIEGSIDVAAKAYGIDRKEVELACSYLDFLQGSSAA